MAGDVLELEIQRTEKDFLDLVGYARGAIFGFWRPVVNCGVAPFAAVVVAALATGALASPDLKQVYLSVGLATAYFTMVLIFLVPVVINAVLKPRYLDEKGRFLSPSRLKVSEQGVAEEGGGFRFETDWEAVVGAVERKRGFILLTDRADGFYVPNGSFRSSAGRDAFVSALQSRVDRVSLRSGSVRSMK